jgi:hypothetical protein
MEVWKGVKENGSESDGIATRKVEVRSVSVEYTNLDYCLCYCLEFISRQETLPPRLWKLSEFRIRDAPSTIIYFSEEESIDISSGPFNMC